MKRQLHQYNQCLTNIQDAIQCPICLGPTHNAIMLPCAGAHILCGDCSRTFFESSKQQQQLARGVGTRSQRNSTENDAKVEANCPSCRQLVCNLECVPIASSRDIVVRELMLRGGVYSLEETEAYMNGLDEGELSAKERARILKKCAAIASSTDIIMNDDPPALDHIGGGEDRKRRASESSSLSEDMPSILQSRRRHQFRSETPQIVRAAAAESESSSCPNENHCDDDHSHEESVYYANDANNSGRDANGIDDDVIVFSNDHGTQNGHNEQNNDGDSSRYVYAHLQGSSQEEAIVID